jgi:hypothetical protein
MQVCSKKVNVVESKQVCGSNCLRNTDTTERIEANLGLTHGTFKKGRKEERRRKNTY